MSSEPYQIEVKPLGGSWGTLGADYAPGVVPEAISHTHELPGGSATLSFTLKRDTRVAWPDLTPFTPIACRVGGVRCWSGRIIQTPTQRGSSSEINVTAQGYWSHLYDDQIDKTWVINDLSRFVDMRSAPVATLASNKTRSSSQVTVGDGVISLLNTTGVPQVLSGLAGVVLDLGPNNVCRRYVVTYTSSSNSANETLTVGGSPSTDPWAGGITGSAGVVNSAGASGTIAGSPGTDARYLQIYHQTSTAYTPGADVWFRITGVQVFTDSADESGNASILKASTVISEAFAAGCDADVVNTTDLTGITTTSFSIPAYATNGRRTVGEIIDDVNSYHGYLAMLSVDPQPRLIFAAPTTAADYILNDADGYEFQNASTNDGSEIYNRVRLRYTLGDGTPAEVTSTPTTDTTFAGRRSFTRTKSLEVRSRLSAAAAQQIADTYLATYASAPMKGSVTVKGTIARYGAGSRVPVGAIQAGDVILLGAETDPQTGTRGRTGRVASVSYSHDEQTASITLDSRRDYLDALLARLGG